MGLLDTEQGKRRLLTVEIPVIERYIEPKELEDFSECFLTGSAAEVTPVAEIGPYRFKPGQISETLMNAYADEVRRSVSTINLRATG